jgi:hypothetical protein
MTAAEVPLLARARRAYEAGRVLLGLRRASVVVPMAAVSFLACGRPAATVLAAGMLALSVTVLEWRGEALGRGARIGLLAGIPPLLLPLIVRATVQACSTSFCVSYSALCLASGVAGGGLVAYWVTGRGVRGMAVVAACAVASLAGSLGCLVAGVGGLLGLAAGLGLGVTPILVTRRG